MSEHLVCEECESMVEISRLEENYPARGVCACTGEDGPLDPVLIAGVEMIKPECWIWVSAEKANEYLPDPHEVFAAELSKRMFEQQEGDTA